MRKNNKYLNDILIVGIIVIVALFILLYQHFFEDNGSHILVFYDGTVIGDYNLYEDQEIPISLEEGYNFLKIRNGRVSVKESNCHDQICVKQKEISKTGESIICLPHKLIIVVEGSDDNPIDGMVY